MPTLEALIKDKLTRLDSVPEAFNSRVIQSQREIFEEILTLLEQLDIKQGQIVISAENLKTIDLIMDDLEQVVNQSEYVEAVRDFAKEFDKQGNITQDMFEKEMGRVDFNSLQDAVLRVKKREAVELLLGSPIDTTFLNPVRATLTDAVSGGASLKDTIKAIRVIAEGDDEKLGRLDRYSKQIAYDAFATSDAAYTNAIADDVGAEWYRYVGATTKDSRPFCVERAGKYYHYLEVEAWASENWGGKANGTTAQTIFIWRGGYNCQHSLIPVLLSSVPPEVVQRNIANGNYKPK